MITIDGRELEKAVTVLHGIPKGIDRATRSALNKTVKGVKTEIKTEVRKEYIVKASDVQNSLSVTMASSGALTAFIKSSGRPIPLSKFKVSPKRIQRRGSKNTKLRVSVKKGGGKTLERAFFAKFQSGHMGVVERVGRKRFPIKELYGPSIPQMISNEEVKDRIEVKAKERLEKNFSHEVERIMKGYGA